MARLDVNHIPSSRHVPRTPCLGREMRPCRREGCRLSGLSGYVWVVLAYPDRVFASAHGQLPGAVGVVGVIRPLTRVRAREGYL